MFRAVERVTGVPRVFLVGPNRWARLMRGRAVMVGLMLDAGASFRGAAEAIGRGKSSVKELHDTYRRDPQVVNGLADCKRLISNAGFPDSLGVGRG